MKTVTATLLSNRPDVNNLVIRNVSEYRVGNNLIWIEYNDGESVVAVKRSDYSQLHIDEQTDVILHGDDFERINCKPYGN